MTNANQRRKAMRKEAKAARRQGGVERVHLRRPDETTAPERPPTPEERFAKPHAAFGAARVPLTPAEERERDYARYMKPGDRVRFQVRAAPGCPRPDASEVVSGVALKEVAPDALSFLVRLDTAYIRPVAALGWQVGPSAQFIAYRIDLLSPDPARTVTVGRRAGKSTGFGSIYGTGGEAIDMSGVPMTREMLDDLRDFLLSEPNRGPFGVPE